MFVLKRFYSPELNCVRQSIIQEPARFTDTDTSLVSVIRRACVLSVFSSSDEKVPDFIKYAYHAP